MTGYRNILVRLLVITASLSSAAVAQNNVPLRVESEAVRLLHELNEQGFEVRRGYFKLWTIDDCDYTANIIGMCYGNNPAAPYVVPTLPRWPEEYVDSVTSNLWGPSLPGYHDIYRFDPREAIVILGLLPPPGAYFSEQTWLFTRQGIPNTESDTYKDIYNSDLLRPFLPIFFTTLPGHRDRTQTFSSLSNIVNNVVIERQSGVAFNQVRYFIMTPDQFMEQAVRNAFARISVKEGDVFTERIPSDMNVGLGLDSDDFTTFIRDAHPRDGGRPGTASDKWRHDLPLVVLRVRDTRSGREPQKYPPVVLEPRIANDEGPLEPDLVSLLSAVGRRWGQTCAGCSAGTFVDLQTGPSKTVGPLCIPIGENCIGDTQDTSYQIYGRMSLDNGEIYAVAGPLGTETGNATYVALGINQVSKLKGVADLSDRDLRGTANKYAREAGNTDKLFLYYFTRDCRGLEYLTDGNCFSIRDLIPRGDLFAITIRNYIKPGTQRGPESSLLLPPVLIQLRRP